MNKIVNKFLLAGDKFMPETHLRQPGFTYSASGPFTTNKERIQKLKETGDSQYIYENKLDKACFEQDMAYRDIKDDTRRTASDKILHHKIFNIAKNPKYDGYQRGLASMVYKFFDKKTTGGIVKNGIIPNKKLGEELHKLIIRNFKKGIVHSPFIDNISGANLFDMQLISKFNKGIRFFLCVIDIFSKYAWIIPLKDKKDIAITNAFQKILDESNLKPKNIWVDKLSEFCNRLVKSWLQKNSIEMYSTHKERKSVIAERIIRTLKDKIK